MGLIDLKTDLKSLKYSKDRIGGGTSHQPFVQKPIPDGFNTVGNTGGLDVLTRGGSLVFEKTADDVSRLSKLLLTANTFQGPAFTIKQNVLSRQNVQTQASPKGLNQGAYLPTSTIAQAAVSATGLHFNTFGVNPIPGSIGSLRTYTDVVTSEQPGFANRLVRFANDFVDDRKISNVLYSYPGGPGSILGVGQTKITIPGEQRTGINSVNRKENFKVRKFVPLTGARNADDIHLFLGASTQAILPDSVTGIQYSPQLGTQFFDITFGGNNPSTSGGGKSALIDLTQLTKDRALGTKNNVNQSVSSAYALASNLTGSLYIPVTGSASNSGKVPEAFRRASQPTVTADQDNVNNLDNLTAFAFTADKLKAAPCYRVDSRLTDFRKTLRTSLKGTTLANGKLNGALIDAPDYSTTNIEERVHLGNPANPLRDLSSYTAGTGLGAVDKINALPLYKSAKVAEDGALPVNDLVKFRIAIVGTDGQKVFIHFRAFLDSVSDSYSADWQSHKYVGRGENFYTYGGFDRKMSLSWTVYAQSKEELIPMYQKLNYLASSLAPRYSGGFMQGTLAELTVGGYVHDQPGIITGLTYELSEQSTWDIGIDDAGGSDDRVKELPHMIKVSGFSFTPIHTFIPQRQQNAYSGANGKVSSFGQERYIGLKAVTNNYDTDVSPSLGRNNATKPNWGTDAEWDAYNKERIRTNDPAFKNTL